MQFSRMAELPPEHAAAPSAFTLSKPIAAINFHLTETGEARTGLITQLPKDAAVEVCGEGFNERTIAVRWKDGFYFVFLQDIEPPEEDA
jgi:hypothetical protein